MKLYIYNKSTNTFVEETSNNKVYRDERIDEVLNQVQCDFYSKTFTKNIAPFTPCFILNGTDKIYWFISTTCNKRMTSKEYYHNAVLIEPTKILQAFVIGSKSFSVIPNKDNYNSNYWRIFILCRLIENKYGVHFVISDRITQMTKERDYQFGKGTTMYDALIEIMQNERCIPKITTIDVPTSTYTLDCFDIGALANQQLTDISFEQKVEMSQNVDDYCSDIESELDSVIDRTNITTYQLTMRSQDNVITDDNACLILPNDIENINKITMPLSTTRIRANVVLMGYDYLKIDKTIDFGNNGRSTLMSIDSVSDYLTTEGYDYFARAWKQMTGYYISSYSYATYFKSTNGKFYITLSNGSLNEFTDTYDYNISLWLLDKDNWELLEETEKPKYIYFNSGSNYIKGFYNVYNAQLINTLLFGSSGPFLKERLNEASYYEARDYDFMQNATMLESAEDVEVGYLKSFELYDFSFYFDWQNFRNYLYTIKAYPTSAMKVSCDKTSTPMNEESYTKTTRTYTNGATIVDFDQLIPDLQRETNMLGRVSTTNISREDIKLGAKTKYGYVISKRAELGVASENNTFTYDFYEDFNSIAEAIGVGTQYEEQKVFSKGIIARHILLETTLPSTTNYDNILIKLTSDAYTYTLVKYLSINKIGNVVYLSCSANTNYSFDSQSATGSGSYRANKDITYCDDNQCATSYNVSLVRFNKMTKAIADMMPMLGGATTTIKNLGSVLTYKDAREKLVFTIKIKEE